MYHYAEPSVLVVPVPDRILVHEEDLKYIAYLAKQYPRIETGGQLFGHYNSAYLPVVHFAIGPGPNARHGGASFFQDVDHLKSEYDRVHSQHQLDQIGEWHSHHEIGLTQLSGGDDRSMWIAVSECRLAYYFMILCNFRSARGCQLVDMRAYFFDGRTRRKTEGQISVLPGASRISRSLTPTFAPKPAVCKTGPITTLAFGPNAFPECNHYFDFDSWYSGRATAAFDMQLGLMTMPTGALNSVSYGTYLGPGIASRQGVSLGSSCLAALQDALGHPGTTGPQGAPGTAALQRGYPSSIATSVQAGHLGSIGTATAHAGHMSSIGTGTAALQSHLGSIGTSVAQGGHLGSIGTAAPQVTGPASNVQGMEDAGMVEEPTEGHAHCEARDSAAAGASATECPDAPQDPTGPSAPGEHGGPAEAPGDRIEMRETHGEAQSWPGDPLLETHTTPGDPGEAVQEGPGDLENNTAPEQLTDLQLLSRTLPVGDSNAACPLSSADPCPAVGDCDLNAACPRQSCPPADVSQTGQPVAGSVPVFPMHVLPVRQAGTAPQIPCSPALWVP